MTPMNTLTAELLDTIRVNRERLTSQEHFLEQLKASGEGLLSQEHFLEQLKASGEGLLSQEKLLTLVSAYRESLARQEQLLQELSPPPPPIVFTEWYPPDNGAAASWSLPTLKLHKVEQTTVSLDILVRLKRTWVGRLYVNHIKHIPLARWLTIRLWRTLYPIYTNTFSVYLGSRASKRWRPLVKLGDYVKTLHLPTTNVFDAARVDTPAPKVFPVEDQAYLVSPHDHYVFPPVYVAELGEALIYGGTNLVFAQDAVICHDLYDFERDYTSEELHGLHAIDAKKMRMHLLRHDATPEKIAVAAAFVDACASNYAHWMTEVLPRIATFCSVEQFAKIPIIVDGGLHRNIMESLAVVVGSGRAIITVPVGRAISVDRLYVTSVTGYVPFDRRDAKLTGHSHGLFSPLALDLLKKRVLHIAKKIPTENWPRKVYLKRTSRVRTIINEVELQKVLHDLEYAVIAPEKLSFLQQVTLFENAEKIVSATGAAIANTIFCKSGAQICILIAKHKSMAYWYWINILSSIGIAADHVLGDIKGDSSKGVHGDFHIDIKNLIEYETVPQNPDHSKPTLEANMWRPVRAT